MKVTKRKRCGFFPSCILSIGTLFSLSAISMTVHPETFINRLYIEKTETYVGNRVCDILVRGEWESMDKKIHCIIGDCGEIMCSGDPEGMDQVSIIVQGTRGGHYLAIAIDDDSFIDSLESAIGQPNAVYNIVYDTQTMEIDLVARTNDLEEGFLFGTFSRVGSVREDNPQ